MVPVARWFLCGVPETQAAGRYGSLAKVTGSMIYRRQTAESCRVADVALRGFMASIVEGAHAE